MPAIEKSRLYLGSGDEQSQDQLSLPNVIEVTETDWEKYDFTKKT